jgi:hypothetical protein
MSVFEFYFEGSVGKHLLNGSHHLYCITSHSFFETP